MSVSNESALIALHVNDSRHQVPQGTTLSELLAILAIDSDSVALVSNGQVIPKSQWQNIACEPNAHIELFGAVAGG
ncbi:sulfur carrier protein ThiS [Shewanella waksmanii]|uniref:sulfur carrier protein ThiS n=1 Tax=Shewanella waksmanii TaxID=213783 RepID=UPI00048BDC01|nr:sulfur carrier protein ThiS [Shewanella waksmanii]